MTVREPLPLQLKRSSLWKMRKKIKETCKKDSGIGSFQESRNDIEISAEALAMIRDILKDEPRQKTALKHISLVSELIAIPKKVSFKEQIIDTYGTASADHYKDICVQKLNKNGHNSHLDSGLVSSDEECWYMPIKDTRRVKQDAPFHNRTHNHLDQNGRNYSERYKQQSISLWNKTVNYGVNQFRNDFINHHFNRMLRSNTLELSGNGENMRCSLNKSQPNIIHLNYAYLVTNEGLDANYQSEASKSVESVQDDFLYDCHFNHKNHKKGHYYLCNDLIPNIPKERERMNFNSSVDASYFVESDQEEFLFDRKYIHRKNQFDQTGFFDREKLPSFKSNFKLNVNEPDDTSYFVESDQEEFIFDNVEKERNEGFGNLNHIYSEAFPLVEKRIDSYNQDFFQQNQPRINIDSLSEISENLGTVVKFIQNPENSDIVVSKKQKFSSNDLYNSKGPKNGNLLNVESKSYSVDSAHEKIVGNRSAVMAIENQSSFPNIQSYSVRENVHDRKTAKDINGASSVLDTHGFHEELCAESADEEKMFIFNDLQDKTESFVKFNLETGEALSFFDDLDLSSIDGKSYSRDISGDFKLEDSFQITQNRLNRKEHFSNIKMPNLRKSFPLPIQRVKVSYVGLNDQDHLLDRSDIFLKKSDELKKIIDIPVKKDSNDQGFNFIRNRMSNIRKAIIKKDESDLTRQIMTEEFIVQDIAPIEFADSPQVTIFDDISDSTITVEKSNFQKSFKERLRSVSPLTSIRGSFELLRSRKERFSVEKRKKERVSIDSQNMNEIPRVTKKLSVRKSTDLIKKLKNPRLRGNSDFQIFDEYEKRQSLDLRNFKPEFNQSMGRCKYQSWESPVDQLKVLEIDHTCSKKGFGVKVAKLFKRFW